MLAERAADAKETVRVLLARHSDDEYTAALRRLSAFIDAVEAAAQAEPPSGEDDAPSGEVKSPGKAGKAKS